MTSWEAIKRLALGFGVKPRTLQKWRERGVPRAWRYDLIRADLRHEIDTADFDRPPGPKHPRQQAESASEAA